MNKGIIQEERIRSARISPRYYIIRMARKDETPDAVFAVCDIIERKVIATFTDEWEAGHYALMLNLELSK